MVIARPQAGEPLWEAHIINENDFEIENVIVVSRGYGKKEEDEQRTSTLRQLLGSLPPHASMMIEPIDPALFHLFHEFWVSYYIGDQIYDKKFIFVPGSLVEENLRYVPHLDMQGIVHQ